MDYALFERRLTFDRQWLVLGLTSSQMKHFTRPERRFLSIHLNFKMIEGLPGTLHRGALGSSVVGKLDLNPAIDYCSFKRFVEMAEAERQALLVVVSPMNPSYNAMIGLLN